MAKSSIHIEAGSFGFFMHNDRSRKTVNSIFSDEKNEVDRSAKDAMKLFRAELKKREEAYQKQKGRKLHAKTIKHLSAIVNLNHHHTLDDVRKVAEHLEKSLGTRVVQVAIHRDEGHYGDDGKPIKNYHAHIEMLGLDEDGNSVRRKLTRSYLTALQDKTAQILGMERGRSYARERAPRPKRLDTYEYKEAKKREQEQRKRAKKAEKELAEALARVKDVNAENSRLRAMLREAGAKRADYAKLEAEIKELRKEAKAKELTITKLRETVDKWVKWREERVLPGVERLKERAETAEKRAQEAQEAKKRAEGRVRVLEAENDDLRANLSDYKQALEEMRHKFSEIQNKLERVRKELERANDKLSASMNLHPQTVEELKEIDELSGGRLRTEAKQIGGSVVEMAVNWLWRIAKQQEQEQEREQERTMRKTTKRTPTKKRSTGRGWSR